MDLRDEVRSSFKRAHKLAKKYYDEGDVAKARVEYLKCAQFAEHLAELTPEKRQEFKERAAKFREIAEGLKGGNIKVFTSGVLPKEEVQLPRQTDKEESAEKAKSLVMVEKPNVRFDDIAGLEEVKENIKEAIVYPFRYPDEYRYFGVKPGGGILLYGPPGCGKTLLAAAAAAECGAVFINLKISDIKDKYVGESEKRIKEVFNLARSYEKAILFFDEIDALAGERSSSMEGHERSLVNELLSQMDGLEAKGAEKRYLVLAATNRPWDVDIALRRAGRFDTTVFIPHPDFEARKKIFELSLKDKPCKADIAKLAEITEGYASAEIVDICEKAAKIPLRERIKEGKPRREITMQDFERVIAERKTVLSSWYPKALKELAGTEEVEIFQELIEAGKRYLLGTPGVEKKENGSVSIDISAEIEKITEGTDIKAPVLEAVFRIALEISREGREGKPVGTAFVIGDSRNVLAKSKQLILNPFEGHRPEERMITNPELKENIKELAQLDGAFVISGDGIIEAAGRYITVDASSVNIPKGMGTRHSSAAGITQATKAVGIVVSQSGGRIKVFREGRIVKSISP
jgi:transitional endoplasmic reticulum ATPase